MTRLISGLPESTPKLAPAEVLLPRDPIPTWYFSLVVARRGDRFLLVQEKEGYWHLPAGRAEVGERLPDAAVRETLEESGIPVRLTGLVRLEHTPMDWGTRVRAFFLAEPIDDRPPKSVADEESLGAAWVPLDRLDAHPLRDPKTAELLRYVANGGAVYPLDVLQPETAPFGEASATTTRVRRHLKAPRAAVYRALLDPRAVATWRVPHGMTSRVHEFEAREGGRFRISLTYDAPTGAGKTTARTDTYYGRFVRLLPDALVIETMEFETDDPSMRGEMKVTFSLTEARGGTDILGVHENLPTGLSQADNEKGWRMALDKLAAYVERETTPPEPDPAGEER